MFASSALDAAFASSAPGTLACTALCPAAVFLDGVALNATFPVCGALGGTNTPAFAFASFIVNTDAASGAANVLDTSAFAFLIGGTDAPEFAPDAGVAW